SAGECDARSAAPEWRVDIRFAIDRMAALLWV
ncbi:hypothetical protein ABIE65_005586, partial [Constrictibacter sp. MBR-5]